MNLPAVRFAEKWFENPMEIEGRHMLVVGAGLSGMAVARFLKKRGARVTLSDAVEKQDRDGNLDRIREMGIETEFGHHRAETFEKADAIIVSPGVPHTIDPLERARERGIEIIGEIELAYRFIREPIIGITGTNGKTTTTTLTGEMIKRSGLKAFVGGNIGNPLIEYADSGEKADVIVAEISSFQLDTITSFRPKVGVLLNITQDHLDRYPDFTAYAGAKARLFENQATDDIAVLNADDPVIESVCNHLKCRRMVFGRRDLKSFGTAAPAFSAKITADRITIERKGESMAETRLPNAGFQGHHNFENTAAALLATLAVGGTVEGVRRALKDFKGLPHRLEYVTTVQGVQYFNDSKATNVDAVIRALEGFAVPVVLILGGRNKGNDFKLLETVIGKHVKKVMVIGEAAAEITDTLGSTVPWEIVSSLEAAVIHAHDAASGGDVVLLSPACASFDMFNSYSERGNAFCHAVYDLKKKKDGLSR